MAANASQSGFVIFLITENSMNSGFCYSEVSFAISNKAKVIPIVIGDLILSEKISILLKGIKIFKIPAEPRQKDMGLIVELVEAILKEKIMVKADLINTLAKIEEKLNYESKYHPEEPIFIKAMGAVDDYCEVYQFPCCGKHVTVGDGRPSRYRSDGCATINIKHEVNK